MSTATTIEKLTNPITFVESLLSFKGKPIRLYPYQKKVLIENDWLHARIVIMKGRAVGMSLLCATAVVYYSYCYSNVTILIFSKTQEQSGYIHRYARMMFDESPLLRSAIKHENKTDLFLNNGSRILARTAGHKAQNIVGAHLEDKGILIVDESAKIPDTALINIMPMAVNCGIVHCSTPESPRGVFYKAAMSEKYKTYKIPCSMSPRIDRETIEEWRELFSPRQFRTEVLGEFASGSGNVFDPDSIYRNVDESLPLWSESTTFQGDESKNYYYSLDPSRGNDVTVLTIGDYDRRNNSLRVVAYHPFRSSQYKDQGEALTYYDSHDDVINQILRYKDRHHFHPVKFYIDSTGDSYYPNRFINHFVWNVEEVAWSTTRKERLIEHLAACFHANRITIPNDDTMINQLLSYSYDLKKMEDGGDKKIYLAGEEDYVDSLCQLSQVITSEVNCESFDWIEAW